MLVLASNSPRRKELLSLSGIDFVVAPAHIDECLLAGETAAEYVLRLAETKARVTLANLEPTRAGQSWVLAADTTVAIDGQILGKPADVAEAEAMLSSLRGRTHQVLSGLALLRGKDGECWRDLCTTDVQMREFSETEMRAYIASGDPFDKAGGYAIQHTGFSPVHAWYGCFANVVGLPLCRLERLLKASGCQARVKPELVCTDRDETTCRVYQQLNGLESKD